MVIDDDVSLVAIVTLKVSCHRFRSLSPSLYMFVIIHELGKSRCSHKLFVPQILYVVGTVSTRRTGDSVALHIHPCVGILVHEIAVGVGMTVEALIGAQHNRWIYVFEERCVATIVEKFLCLNDIPWCAVGSVVYYTFKVGTIGDTSTCGRVGIAVLKL